MHEHNIAAALARATSEIEKTVRALQDFNVALSKIKWPAKPKKPVRLLLEKGGRIND